MFEQSAPSDDGASVLSGGAFQATVSPSITCVARRRRRPRRRGSSRTAATARRCTRASPSSRTASRRARPTFSSKYVDRLVLAASARAASRAGARPRTIAANSSAQPCTRSSRRLSRSSSARNGVRFAGVRLFVARASARAPRPDEVADQARRATTMLSPMRASGGGRSPRRSAAIDARASWRQTHSGPSCC